MGNERPESKALQGEAEGGTAATGQRLGGARADFVASLGRKVTDARALLSALEEEPAESGPRDELRRKLHALGAAARLLHFDAMAKCIADAESVLEHIAQAGTAREADLVKLAQALDDLPALAWGEVPSRSEEMPLDPASGNTLFVPTLSALIVGGAPLADALTEEEESSVSLYECERTEHAQAALGLARALAPDVVVVDSDVDGALNLVESLLDDPLTEPVPIVVIGSFRSAEQAARFVALGVAKTLTKPVSPSVLRRACQEVIDQREGRTMRVALGEPTLEQLGERLAEEVRRAIVDSVDTTSRSCRVVLGEGTEVLGAIWGAIARVREVITMRTDGVVRYSGDGPEGAVAMAPWLHHEGTGADRVASPPRGRGAAADVNLDRRRVIVADDDPGVTWFIADLLRTTGCVVHEALDGQRALELAYELSPELVVSDILMPGLDGFALCRALRRDVALRDTPVILLSWKEDLLQRVRELGASAAAYLRKESDARAIVARVREVLRPRARVEARLKGNGEIRGRLDGLTVRSLLELVCAVRPASRVSVRDASFLYEVEIRDGAPRRATRTAADGSFQRGERVLAAMLGVGAGRFVVSPASSGAPLGDLAGTLSEQLAGPIAAARAALRATTGARTMNVERVVLDEDALAGYLLATPQPARDLIRRIAQGSSPRAMLLHGDVAPSLLEDVFADLAARGTILAVQDANGTDLLATAVEKALADGQKAKVESSARAQGTPSPLPASDVLARELPGIAVSTTSRPKRPSAPGAGDARPLDLARPAASPSSLEDAVMRAMSDRSPAAGAAPMSSEQPPIVQPSELRPRSSNPPAGQEGESRMLPSVPPDAIVPSSASSGDMPAAPPARASEPPVKRREASVPLPLEGSGILPGPADPLATVPSSRKRPEVRSPTASNTSENSGEGKWALPVLLLVILVIAGAAVRWWISSRPYEQENSGAVGTFELPPGVSVAVGQGLLEVAVAPEIAVRIDGTESQVARDGRVLRIALPKGSHELRVGWGTAERVRVVEVQEGRATRADFDSP